MLRPDRIRKFTPKEALINLIRISEQLKHLKNNEPKYSELIDCICNMDWPIPAMSVISTDTGLKKHILEQQLKDLYLLVLEKDSFLKFETVEYNLIYKFDKMFYNLKLNYLAVIPKVGETFESHFLEGILGVGVFTVQRIMHKLEKDKQVVDIFLGEYQSERG